MAQKFWTEDETLVAFRLYCLIPFGRIHARNPLIIKWDEVIGRGPDALAMKMLNFASLDPKIRTSGRKGLGNASNRARELWEKFHSHMSDLFWASEEALKRLGVEPEAAAPSMTKLRQFTGATETTREVPVRRAQRFFRDTVLASYNFTCAVSGITKPELLCASHIIPWRTDVDRRTDPRNGISLSALHDRAFDRGLISFDDAHALLVSDKLKQGKPNSVLRVAVLEFEGKQMEGVDRFAPDPAALAYHRECIYKPA